VAGQSSPSTNVGILLNSTYRLERVIAEGGMGVVWEAAHVRLPRRFAVKILAKPVDKESTPTLARFRREAEIASTLAHPHIVEVFDYQVSESGAPYLVMELLEGEDLADRLRKGKLHVAGALRVVEEIAQALDVAHTNGVVHRDLKPANIFLSKRAGRDDFVKVLDFGVSKLIDSATLTQEKAMVGTPLYMSPEQAIGTQELTPESDIFSLGAICYEMLTGRRAFAAASIPSILYQIVHGPTPKVAGKAPGLSTAVDEVFGRVLSKRKEDRYRRASQFAEDLRLALGREGVTRTAAMISLSQDTLDELVAQAEARAAELDGGAGEMTGSGGDTEVDSSTKAEEAMVVAESRPPTMAKPRTPSVIVAAQASDSFERSYTDLLTARPRRRAVVLAAVLAVGATAGAIALVLRAGERPLAVMAAAGATETLAGRGADTATARARVAGDGARPASAAATAEGAAAAGATSPGAAPAATETEPAGETAPATASETAAARTAARAAAKTAAGRAEFEPETITQHAPVQFVFHVWPRGAEIFVDDKKVDGNHLTVPFQNKPRNVVVRAPGYRTLAMPAPATANRAFELRMERIVVRVKKPSAPPRRAHDAAPVQDQ
jgi:serine/threonine protein kinase